MTQKFIPFDPNTAKNGDILHYAERTEWSYIYIGPCPNNKNASVVFNPRDNTYGFNYNDSMVVKQPMKTVWINMYYYSVTGHNIAYVYDSAIEAEYKVEQVTTMKYIGTFPIEIHA